MPFPRVLVMHNRYRIEGGEERSVGLHVRALERAGVEHRLLERRSNEAGRVRAATALLRGGEGEEEVADAVASLGADVVHVHNMQPLLGPRTLAAARGAGARVVLHLHNVRLFCAIGVASRDGAPCFRCHHGFTLPGLVLNCRDSLPEAAVYAAALSVHQPQVLDTVDRFVAPSGYAVEQLSLLGLPRERLEALPHYLPADAFAGDSAAHRGGYALAAARLSAEKGLDVAVRACAAAGVPLKIAGEGGAAGDLAALAAREGAPAELVGRVGRDELGRLLRGAAMTVLPSRYHEFAPYAVLESMAAGVPVVGTELGGVPELIGADRCVPANDVGALAARMRALWEDPDLRRSEGLALLERARERHSEERFTAELLGIYERVTGGGR